MKVYVVEFGEYSDRNISGVYSTEERAKIAASTDGDITEYEVDAAFGLYDKGLRPFSVTISYGGDIVKVLKDEYSTETATCWNMASSVPFELYRTPMWDCLDVKTWARDERHAIKIASEHHAEVVAAGWDGQHYFNPTLR
jgi:hypothetical protein